MLQIGHLSLIPVGGFLLGNRFSTTCCDGCRNVTPLKIQKIWLDCMQMYWGGGVSLARRIASTNIFTYRRYRGTHKQPTPARLTPPDTPSMFLHVYARA